MKSRAVSTLGVVTALILITCSACTNLQQNAQANALAQMERDTGLQPVQLPGTTNRYLGKNHRGYEVLYTAQAGDVWGRYAIRLTMGEIGREVGGIMSFLTGSYRSGVGGVTGSPLDRLLSQIIGQPLSVTILLKHGRPAAPRLDIVSSYAKVRPEDPLPEVARIGFKAGTIHTRDAAYGQRISSNAGLMKRMSRMRCQYIRVDGEAVSFLWSGSETDYSGMIGDHGGYAPMVNDILDTLADLADAIHAP